MYRIDETQHKIIEANKYFHYDDIQYNLGDTIVKHYELPEDIVIAYNKTTGKDLTNIVYMLNYRKEEYQTTYDYEYLVKCESPLKCRMDLSPIMCKDYIERNKITDKKRKLFIDAMSNAYVYNDNLDLVRWSLISDYITDKVEYIDNNVKVKKLLHSNK